MISDQDFERLSAYVDNELPAAEKSALEARLAREPELKSALDDLRLNVRALRSLPVLKPPRNFTLSAEQAQAIRPPKRSPGLAWLPVLRLATAAATFLFVAVLGLDLMSAGNLVRPQMVEQTQVMESAMQAPAASESKAADVNGTPLAEALPYAAPLVEESGTPAPTGPMGITTSGAGGAESGTPEMTGTPEPAARNALSATETPDEATAVALAQGTYPAPPSDDAAADAVTVPSPEPATSVWRRWTIGLGVLTAALALTTWIMTRRR
jgi:hypothetical protein